MSSDRGLISEDELRREYSEWMKRHSILPSFSGGYLDNVPLPDVPLVYSQSAADENGDIISLFKGVFRLKASFSKTGKEEEFVFFKVQRTFVEFPDLVPDTAGYIIQ